MTRVTRTSAARTDSDGASTKCSCACRHCSAKSVAAAGCSGRVQLLAALRAFLQLLLGRASPPARSTARSYSGPNRSCSCLRRLASTATTTITATTRRAISGCGRSSPAPASSPNELRPRQQPRHDAAVTDRPVRARNPHRNPHRHTHLACLGAGPDALTSGGRRRRMADRPVRPQDATWWLVADLRRAARARRTRLRRSEQAPLSTRLSGRYRPSPFASGQPRGRQLIHSSSASRNGEAAEPRAVVRSDLAVQVRSDDQKVQR